MKTLKTLGGGLSFAALTLVSSIAHAELTGNIGIASEYVFRGLPSSNNGAQVSGGLDWSSDNVYAGTWISNVGNNASGNEVDVYAGFNSGPIDIGAIAYAFPGDGRQAFGCVPCGSPRLAEIYGGYNQGIFSGYVWYGLGSYFEAEDDYIYVEGNLSAPLNDGIEVGFHVGVWSGIGDDYDNNDEIVDLGFTGSYGGLWMSVTSILDNDDMQGEFQRPRVNIGYTWTFDKLPMPNISM